LSTFRAQCRAFPINTAKNLLGDLIGHLRPTDYFDVVLFSGDSTTLSTEPLAANQENVSRAFDLLDRQRGAGGTELLPALQEAMKIPHRQKAARSIVVVTDGYISGESDLFEYIKENRGGANIFSFGIGSSVNRYLIDGVAKAGLGEPFVVTDQSQASATADKFREYIQSPLLTNVEIRSHGFETYDVQPGRFSDLLAKRPVILFGKWKGNPTGTLELTGTNGQGEYSNSIDVSAVQPDENNRALRYLWPGQTSPSSQICGSDNVSDEKVKAITELGLEYNLLTKYTSLYRRPRKDREPVRICQRRDLSHCPCPPV
jgi:Ca-activated chloride channel family protein